jgi:hypothetical protein
MDASLHRVARLPSGHPLAGSRLERSCIANTRPIVRRHNDLAKQVDELAQLYSMCGDGFGIAWRIGHLHLQAGEHEQAGKWLIREAGAAYPYFVDALQDIGTLLPSLTDAQRGELRRELRRLGSTPQLAMWLPTTKLQMGYIGTFVCDEGARFAGQVLVEDAGISMDKILYECVDGTTGGRYYVLPNMTALHHGT